MRRENSRSAQLYEVVVAAYLYNKYMNEKSINKVKLRKQTYK